MFVNDNLIFFKAVDNSATIFPNVSAPLAVFVSAKVNLLVFLYLGSYIPKSISLPTLNP